jgi:hypothetical protein
VTVTGTGALAAVSSLTSTVKDIIITDTMASYRTTRFIQITFVLLLVVLVVVALVYVGRMLFFSGTATTPPADASQSALVSTIADRAVRLSVRGPIVADENFRSYQIQVTPTERVLTLYKGYLKQPFDNVTLGNNIPSYEQFVYALDRANMMSGSEFSGVDNDTRGICATGKLYEFQILKADKVEKTLWTTSCPTGLGSETGSLATLTAIFPAQIPGSLPKIGRLWQ